MLLLLCEAIESWKHLIRGLQENVQVDGTLRALNSIQIMRVDSCCLRNVLVDSGAPKESRHDAKSLKFFFQGNGFLVSRGPVAVD